MKMWPGIPFNGRSGRLYEATEPQDFPPEDVGLAFAHSWNQQPPEPVPAPVPSPPKVVKP